jgi:uncharacterized protein YciI
VEFVLDPWCDVNTVETIRLDKRVGGRGSARMSSRFLYWYFMRDQPDLVRDVVPQHVRYWHDLNLPGYLGGPFTDRSGGSISFVAVSYLEAEELVDADPFVASDLLSERWLKEWHVE